MRCSIRRRRSTSTRPPLDDQGAFSIFRTGNTAAVFQFESRGMRELLKQAPVTRFEDIIALVALYRPGRWSFDPGFVARSRDARRSRYGRRLELHPVAHLRRDGVPGAGDEDRAGGRRLALVAPTSAAAKRAMEEAEEMAAAPRIFVEGP